MTKLRILYRPYLEDYVVQQNLGWPLNWSTMGGSSAGGADYDYTFSSKEKAIHFIDDQYKERPSRKPIVVWATER